MPGNYQLAVYPHQASPPSAPCDCHPRHAGSAVYSTVCTVPYITNMPDHHHHPPPHVQAAAYSFAQFTTSYAWGLFSNKYGRKVRSTYRRGIMQQLQLVPGCW